MHAPLFSLAWRESRSARRRLLLYMSSISLGVAALVAIDSFAANVMRSVHEQSRALFGGDAIFSRRDGWTPATDSLLDSLSQSGVTIAKVTTFASMTFAPRTQRTRLAQVRAVGDAYPLYGEITTVPSGHWGEVQQGRNAVADPALFIALDVHVGDSITIGYEKFALVGAIASAPASRGMEAAIGPRVYIAGKYLADTKLLVTGSRASFEANARLASGDPSRFVRELGPRLEPLQMRGRSIGRLEGSLNAGIELLSNFLGIVGVVALLLGGVGVASGVHAWVTHKIDTVAVLRCLGATTRQVMVIYATQAAAMGLLGAAIGAALGIGIQFLLPGAVRDLLPVDVTVRLEPAAIATGMLLGLWIALAFALRPLITLRRISPLQALRRNEDPAPLAGGRRDGLRLAVNAVIALTVVGLSATRSRSPVEVAGFSLAIAVAVGLLAASAWALSTLARRTLRRGWPYVVRQGVANLYRPGNQTRSVILSLGFGAFLVTTLFLVQTNLLAQFQQFEFESRGNLVFFDVQEDQQPGVDSLVRSAAQEVIEETPIVTMRIASINGRSTEDILGDSTRRREGGWGLRREYRSTYRDHLTSAEKLVAGTFPTGRSGEGDGPPYEVSLDQDLATSLHVALGDTITWNVQGVPVVTRVTSLRQIDWDRFEANFFAVFEPAALEPAPKMFALLVRATGDTAVATLQASIVRRFPNVASIDLSQVRKTVAQISERATLAIRFLAIFSLAMGIPVLFTAVSATRRDRVREGVLLKTLGATRRQITRILFSEYALLGVLGSLTGMLLSFGGAWLLLHFIFDRPFHPAAGAALAIAGAMILLSVGIGLLAGRDVFRETPMSALREA